MRKKLVERLCSQGILIEPSALKMLQAGPEPLATLERFLGSSRQNPLLITGTDVREFLDSENAKAELQPAPAPPPPSPDEEEPDEGAARPSTGVAMYMDAPSMVPPPVGPEPIVLRLGGGEAGSMPDETPTVPAAEPPKTSGRTSMSNRAAAKGYDSDVAVIQEITDESRCTGQASDFKNYFEDRLRVLSRLLKQRPEMGGAVKVESALGYDAREARVICMVSDVARPQDKRVRGTWLTVEDETGTMRVWLPDEGGFAGKYVLKDEVIGILGKVQKPRGHHPGRDRGNYIVAQHLIRPELVGPRTPRRSENPLVMACAGDLHVGSSHFLPKPWGKLVSWLKSGDGTAGNVKYLLMPGDMVDGIGIYPNQDEELEIDDVYLQYERLATMLAEIPDHIALIILPGNHDAQRLSEPQPALPQKVRDILGTRPSYVGNPSYLMVDGVRVLAYHGRGFDDFAGNLGPIGYQQPMLLMQEMLKRRHMSPIYGGKNQLAPERRDHMVINPVPDVFVTGHVHGAGIEDYKGVVNINASTLQSQTPFQASHNFNPDPGKVPWVRLDTFEFGMESFF
ncbi:MAG: DNA-directed DNA polymerase II small subunit [Methanobacteriota archaeon]